MVSIIMICGRICSGKTTYTERLCHKRQAVVLSIDELMLSVLGSDTGDSHDEYVRRTERYLYKKSVEIVNTGTDVILDWGFWTKMSREYARKFYGELGIPFEFHYIEISDDEWQKRINKRNSEVSAGRSDAYFIDEGLAAKFEAVFESPDEGETDVKICVEDPNQDFALFSE